MKNPFRKRARIVQDSYLGYEVQVWRWWFPVWLQAAFSNTHCTVEDAEHYARIQLDKVVKEVEK